MEALAFALVAIAFVTAGFFVWYFIFKARQEERRFLIEQGYKLEDLPQTQMSFTFPWRKTGIVLVAVVFAFDAVWRQSREWISHPFIGFHNLSKRL